MFRSPNNPKMTLAKRIIAVEGDLVYPLPFSPYAKEQGLRQGHAVRVPAGACWVEGDERFHSKDSNEFGPVPLGLITAKVSWILFPFTRFGKVERVIRRDRVVEMSP